jgi:CheY-like chemotaxis protein
MVDRHPCEHILIVDPDPDLREAVRSVLEEAGCTVADAGDVRGALERLRTFAPDVILLDVGLDAADEIALLEWLRTGERTASIPVVVMSGSPATLRRVAPRASGALEKPFDLETLFETLGELCATAAA